VGFDLSAATLNAQTGITDFTISPLSTANELILTRAPDVVPAGSVSYTLDTVINPTPTATYFVRVETFASDDATGSNIDSGGLAYYINTPLNLNATVPPFLLFCVGTNIPAFDCSTATGDFIDFGELSSTGSKTGHTQMLIATNVDTGYTISVQGTTLTSGTNVINALSSNDVSKPGVSQFGLNLRANNTPNTGTNPQGPGLGTYTGNYGQRDFFRFNNGEVIASGTNPEDYRRYTTTYLVNITKNQPAGIYVSTMTYVALANF
jgi:hypothetical protein